MTTDGRDAAEEKKRGRKRLMKNYRALLLQAVCESVSKRDYRILIRLSVSLFLSACACVCACVSAFENTTLANLKLGSSKYITGCI